MDKKSLLLVLLGYLIWGFQPLYWGLLGHLDSYTVLAWRILFGAVFTVVTLACAKRLPELWSLLKDKKRMRFLLPAAFFLLIDWAVFIVAVQNGHVLDTSLGYYMNPLVIFLLSIVLFREKCTKLQAAAIALAAAGVIINAIQYGKVPVISLVLAMDFAVYGALKKYAKAAPLVSIAAETLVLSPLALLALLFLPLGGGQAPAYDAATCLLLVGAGAVTALPMIFYSRGVNKLTFLLMGFVQYLSPTISLVCGLFMGETLTPDKLVSFLFIWASLCVFSINIVREERKKRKCMETA